MCGVRVVCGIIRLIFTAVDRRLYRYNERQNTNTAITTRHEHPGTWPANDAWRATAFQGADSHHPFWRSIPFSPSVASIFLSSYPPLPLSASGRQVQLGGLGSAVSLGPRGPAPAATAFWYILKQKTCIS